MRTKKIFTITFVFILLVLISLFLYHNHHKKNITYKKNTQIDVIIPQTGNLAFIGKQIKNGMLLALTETKDSLLTINFIDSKGNSKSGINAVNKALLDKPNFIIVNLTSVAMASKPILSNKSLNAIYLSTHPEILNDCNNCFRFFTSGKQESKYISQEILNNSIHKLGLMYVNDSYGTGTAMFIKKLVKNNNIRLVDLSYPIKDFNFLSLVSKAKSEKIDGILLIGYGFEYSLLFKTFNELNFFPHIYSNFSFSNKEGKENILKYKGKITYSAPKYDMKNKTNNNMKNFISSYKIKYGNIPDFNAAYGYDNIKIINDYVMQNNHKNFKEFLSNYHYSGAMGKYIFLQDGDVKTEIEIIKIN